MSFDSGNSPSLVKANFWSIFSSVYFFLCSSLDSNLHFSQLIYWPTLNFNRFLLGGGCEQMHVKIGSLVCWRNSFLIFLVGGPKEEMQD